MENIARRIAAKVCSVELRTMSVTVKLLLLMEALARTS